jgi:hypothetical protein
MLSGNATHLTLNFGEGEMGKTIITETGINIMGASLI